jgi:hypothetical protein
MSKASAKTQSFYPTHILWLKVASLDVVLSLDAHSRMTYSSGTDILLEWWEYLALW